MKIVALYFCDELVTVFDGRHYKFMKNVPVEVDDPLADKLLSMGEFIQILGGNEISNGVLPEPIVPPVKKKRCKGCH